MKHIVCHSGGEASAIVGIEVARKFGPENVTLVNHDIHFTTEDRDIKRFKQEVADHIGVPITYAGDRLRALISEWRTDTEDREGKSGYERGVDFAFVKAANDLEAVIAAANVQPKGMLTPLTRKQIDDIMTEHYPLDSLLRENVDAFEACVRDIEKALAAQAPAPAQAWRADYPASETELSAEREKARADERLYGLGATVNGWHVPAHVVSIYRLAQTAPAHEPLTEEQAGKLITEATGWQTPLSAHYQIVRAVERAYGFSPKE